MTTVAALSTKVLDRRPGRHFVTISGVQNVSYVGRDGLPRDKKDKVIPLTRRQRFHLQDGRIFDAAGNLLAEEDVPQYVKDKRAERQARRAVPGVTHRGRVIECSVRGCAFATCMESAFREHLRRHDMSDTGRAAALARSTGNRERWAATLGDFADPAAMLNAQQGPSGTTPRPDEE